MQFYLLFKFDGLNEQRKGFWNWDKWKVRALSLFVFSELWNKWCMSYEINHVWVNSLLVINWYYFLTSRLDQANSDEMKSKLAKLGLAAVLAYGLFDAVTYTSFFVLAFLGYEKSTGKNPAANLQALFGVRNWQLLRTFLV